MVQVNAIAKSLRIGHPTGQHRLRSRTIHLLSCPSRNIEFGLQAERTIRKIPNNLPIISPQVKPNFVSATHLGKRMGLWTAQNASTLGDWKATRA